MKDLALAQFASSLLAVCTPWIVAAIVRRVAATHTDAGSLDVRSMRLLHALTAAAAIVVSIGRVAFGPSPWLLVVVGVGFAVTAAAALRVLGEIDEGTHSMRQIAAGGRTAELKPRRAGEYLPWSWRLTITGTAVVGATAFVMRAANSGAGRRMFVPVVFTGAAVIFLWLYEVWAHQVITGPVIAGDRERVRRIVRRIFAMEALLVVVCLGTAHALLDLNWAANRALGAGVSLAGSLVAIFGCALAVASGLVGRQYKMADSRSDPA